MTKREAKAVEIERTQFPHMSADLTDEELLQTDDVQATLRGMDWMAQECANMWMSYDQPDQDEASCIADSILNAGKEEV